MRNEEGGDVKEFSDWAAVTPDFEQLANLRIEPLAAGIQGQSSAGLADGLTAIEKNRQLAEQQADALRRLIGAKPGPYEQAYPTYAPPRLGWACPNCGRCFAPHIASCSVCIGMQYWPHPSGLCPPSQPSPWWQVPPLMPNTWTNRDTVTAMAAPGLGVVRTDGPEPTSRLDV